MSTTDPPIGELPLKGYIRQAQMIPGIIPFSSATLWRKVKAGTFPAPIKLSERVTAWRVEHVRAWMQYQDDAASAVREPVGRQERRRNAQPIAPPAA